jgi:Domain of unknown function (DUF4214)
MRRLVVFALLGLLLCGPVSTAQPSGDSTVTTVKNWYRQFLRRDAEPSGLMSWSDALRQGNPPALMLSAILGSDEYYNNAGGTSNGFVRSLYLDLTGREPTVGELAYWSNRLNTEYPREVAYGILTRYPLAWSPAQYQPTPSSYRRGYR